MSVYVRHEIPFHDVDSLKIVWHGHYYKYFELARTALYRSYGLDVSDSQEMGYIFPVIESHCRYAQPLHYGQSIDISATLVSREVYLHIEYHILEAGTEKSLARGFTKQAVCRAEDGLLLMQVPDKLTQILDT